MKFTDEIIHTFESDISHIHIPEMFTYPFNYTPHQLTSLASEYVMNYLNSAIELKRSIDEGKMFGVLVVMDSFDKLKYVAAFSGNINGTNALPGFVPPIYDILQANEHFKIEEAYISNINKKISELSDSKILSQYKDELSSIIKKSEMEIFKYKNEMSNAKRNRDILRTGDLSVEENDSLIKQSQHEKAELKRLKVYWNHRINEISEHINTITQKINVLKAERKRKSEELQNWLFKQYTVHNALGQTKSIYDIFQNVNRIPPAGTGECAAPKLLEFAYRNKLKPICMGEFWWGKSPVNEVRHHTMFYASCRSKCFHLLSFMMQGLSVESNPHELDNKSFNIKILYQDEWLVIIDKPNGMLSLPGKIKAVSAIEILKAHIVTNSDLLPIHRLDMDTSGILIFAKDAFTQKAMQKQFEEHSVIKHYIAILDGCVPNSHGTISLPLSPDPYDTPRQTVDYVSGKPAITHYRVIDRNNKHTLIEFTPITGRTHQLRIHSAHAEGLHMPIVGDSLYGTPGDRLFLHASYIEFTHPHFSKKVSFSCPHNFKI